MSMTSITVKFPFVEGNVSLKAEDIIYIETNRHKNIFFTRGKTYSIYRKLDEIETELRDCGFVRTHQSFLVNMRYVEKISGYVMKLNTGAELSVPKARYQEVKKRYLMYKENVHQIREEGDFAYEQHTVR